jgi:capsular polysaccharide biosynthesis protein
MLTASALTKQTRPKEQGAADGTRDFPSATATQYASETEQIIHTLCQEDAAEEYGNLSQKIETFRAEISTVRLALPSDIASTANNIRAGLATVLMEHADDIREAAGEVERRAKDLRQFKLLNDLSQEPKYNPSMTDLFGMAIFLIFSESAINAYFFGQASDAGLAGGFFTAAIISSINVAIGFLAGVWPLRQMTHVKRWRLLIAVPAFFLAVAGAATFNLIVGYYRDSLQKDPDQQLLDIVPAAMRHLGEIQSFESLVLVILGCLIFAASGYKGYTVWDTYPGYMSKHKALKKSEAELKRLRIHANATVDKRLLEQLEQFKAIGSSLAASRKILESVAQKIDRDYTAVQANIDQTEAAGQAAIQVYRQANIKVRNPRAPPPPYFHAPFKIDRGDSPELQVAREELQTLAKQINHAETEFQAAQRDIASERLTIMSHLEDTIAKAENDARSRVKADQESERAERDAFKVSRNASA